jgi:Ras-related protein Rab-1A
MAEDEYDYIFKVLLIGNSDVGKSSLILRYVDQIWNDVFVPTIGVDFKVKSLEVDKKLVKMQIWDTAGQEKFNSIISNYYKGTDVGIFVYAIDNEKSFQDVENWFKNLKENTSDKTLNILIGNKRDIDDEKEGGKRMVTYERAEKFADDNHFYAFREITCKSKDQYELDNILEIFDEIGKYFYDQSKENKNTNTNSTDINYKVSDSMMSLGRKHKIKEAGGQIKTKKKCC